jgi:hypothetical protein
VEADVAARTRCSGDGSEEAAQLRDQAVYGMAIRNFVVVVAWIGWAPLAGVIICSTCIKNNIIPTILLLLYPGSQGPFAAALDFLVASPPEGSFEFVFDRG